MKAKGIWSCYGATTFTHNGTQHNRVNCDTQDKDIHQNDDQHKHYESLCRVSHFLIVMLSDIILIVAYSYCYAELHNAECRIFSLLC